MHHPLQGTPQDTAVNITGYLTLPTTELDFFITTAIPHGHADGTTNDHTSLQSGTKHESKKKTL